MHTFKKRKKADEVAAINADIKEIFRKHKVRPNKGEEGFWLAVDEVKRKNKADARKLNRLANHWAVAMSFNLKRSA